MVPGNQSGEKIMTALFKPGLVAQEEAIVKLLKANKKVLKRQIKKYDGKLVNGILVTESGLLAAAHLVGPGSVKKWVRNGRMFEDGNGIKLTEYIQTFNGYQLDI